MELTLEICKREAKNFEEEYFWDEYSPLAIIKSLIELVEQQDREMSAHVAWHNKEVARLISERNGKDTLIESQKAEIEKAVNEIKFQVNRNDQQREAYFKLEADYLALQKGTPHEANR